MAMEYGLVTLTPLFCYVLCYTPYALLCCVVLYIYPTPTPPPHTRTSAGAWGGTPGGVGVGYKHQAPSQSAPYRLNIREKLSP